MPFEEARPDYPLSLVPFRDHPRFVAASPRQKQDCLSWGWMAYNRNTIIAEEKVANPAFALVLHDRFPGTVHPSIKSNVVQSMVDESYHTLMHTEATLLTEQQRGLRFDPRLLPQPLTYRWLREAQGRTENAWERDLLTLAFAVVSEVSINAYLSLLSGDETIQRSSSMLTALHNKDEFAHALVIAEIAKSIYVHLDLRQKDLFGRALSTGLHAFVASDFETWRALLHVLGFAGADEIIGDCIATPGNRALVRDYSGLEGLAAELGILDRIDFAFA
jgi:hypothetical protein